MKRFLPLIFTSLLMLIFIPACNLTAAVTTPTPFNLDTVQTAVAATLAAQPTSAESTTPGATEIPTLVTAPTTAPIPTARITYDDSIHAARIQFAPMTAWADITGTSGAQQSSTYVLGAAKGQIMTVSVLQGRGYNLTLTSQDGTALTPADNGYSFWRGALPATQDYFIKVNAPVDGDFTFRVAINPPGMTDQALQYTYPPLGLSLAYTDSFTPVVYPYVDQQRGLPMLALNFSDFSFYDKTNLSEAYFVLNLFDDPAIVATCNQLAEGEEARGQETYNGLTYDKSFGGGVGAGNYYMQTKYHAVQQNTCIEVVFFVHYTNIGNYVDTTVKEYDDAALTQKFENILKSLRFK